MILRVGPFLYRVHFVEEELVHEGERCLGLCDNETHDIYVAANTSFAQQIQIISHEYMEAWIYHFGQSEPDKEAYCDIFGMAMAQFIMDLVRQFDHLARDAGCSGLGALSLEFESQTSKTRSAADTRASRSARSRQCSSALPGSSAEHSHSRGNAHRELIATKLAQAAQSAGLRLRQPLPEQSAPYYREAPPEALRC